MGDTANREQKKHINIGLLAHVDAGKTTLSEALLYTSGGIRKLGRVDNRDAFLDTYELERERGITIFSKQAQITWGELEITLLDTPGHVDFSAEMERTLQALDYAILVISGADGVQAHTQTLWSLLKRYGIPVFLFVNKMDQRGTDKDALLLQLQERLDGGCVDFTDQKSEAFFDALAMCTEEALEQFLEHGRVELFCIQDMVKRRETIPCFFGSALKLKGIEEFLDGIKRYVKIPRYDKAFAAKAFKIARDDQGMRLTYLKVTGGALKVRDVIEAKDGTSGDKEWEEKINQIRIYSGAKYETVEEAAAGTVCAVTGLTRSKPGDGYGAQPDSSLPVLEPVLNYKVKLPEGMDAAAMLPKLRQLEEEEPQLHIVWNEQLQEIQAQLMGEVQLEILSSMIKERFGVDASFGDGNIVYKETIADSVEGVGHFEPLRHYAEVHLLLEPLERGGGMQFATACSEDVLDKNWQRLVLTHLEEREHKGVLTGAPLTDMKITLLTGRAHQKHTEGGDFRQAVYRAVRQGLMQAQSVLLEPYYDFRLELPDTMVGRAMTDIEAMHGHMGPPAMEDGHAVLTGSAPAATMRGYQKEVTEYTRGLGHLQCTHGGYAPCHNTEEVLEQKSYDPQADLENPSSSVFCAHGAGFLVGWDEVRKYMHVESPLKIPGASAQAQYESALMRQKEAPVCAMSIGEDEVEKILAGVTANRRDHSTGKASHKKTILKKKRVYDANFRDENGEYDENMEKPVDSVKASAQGKRRYFLVDGYNIIFAWPELSLLAKDNIEGARGRLLDIMCNYQALKQNCLIVVFDAYRVEGHKTEYFDYHNIHVVFTKEAETADQYIERFAHENGRKYQVTVATSDGLEQIIIQGQGCALVSARELEDEIRMENERVHKEYLSQQPHDSNLPFEKALMKL